MARIEFRNIQKSFGDVLVIPGMDLVIEDGEFVALLGPSGCGKSTSLLMLAGIYLPSGGEMLFDGALVNEVEARDRNVGIVFQSYALYPHMSVLQNIMFPLKFKKVPEADARRRAEEAARLVQVHELLQRRPAELSGGQQQRVALARALVKRPQLLLLDEPLSNLDATLRLTMRAEIKTLQRRLGVTSILVTHDQLEATTMADRIICMSKGEIEQIGTPDDLYLRPQSLFVAGFIGAPPINLLSGEVAGDRLRIDGASLPYEGDAGGPVVLGLRPEALRFEAGGLRRPDHRGRADGTRDPVPGRERSRHVARARGRLLGAARFRRPGDRGVRRRRDPDLRSGERAPGAGPRPHALLAAVLDLVCETTTAALEPPSQEQRAALLRLPPTRAAHAEALARHPALFDRVELAPPPAAKTLVAPARIAFWNAERGKDLDASTALLGGLAADVLLLCELDLGMARSGQAHTTRELARRLGTGYAFAVEFLELGLGDAREQAWHAGQLNQAGLHGAAILSACMPSSAPR